MRSSITCSPCDSEKASKADLGSKGKGKVWRWVMCGVFFVMERWDFYICDWHEKISPCETPTAMLLSHAKTNGVSKLTEIYKVPSLELAWNLHLKPFAWNLGTSYNVWLEPLYIWNMGTFSWNRCLLGTFTEHLWLGTLKPWNLMHP